MARIDSTSMPRLFCVWRGITFTENMMTKPAKSAEPVAANYPPLHSLTQTAICTEQAAFYLGRRPQTLLKWACKGGPIAPARFHGRLLWPVAQLRLAVEGAL
jgi:hypothetical protein